MTRRTTRWVRMATAVMAAGLMAAGSMQGAMAEDEKDGRKLEGTWVFAISIHQCATGAAIGAPFQSLLTFAPGGVFTETTDNPMFFPALRGPGHGVWSATGEHSYKAASVAFVTMNGALVKAQTIAQTIEVESADTLRTTSAEVKFLSPDLKLLGSACAEATARRLDIDKFF